MSDVTGTASPETTAQERADTGLLPLADPRLRAAIAAEIATRRPLPVAHRTLTLMTESALLDHGLRADASEAAVQDAVRAAVDGLAARHPALFDADPVAGAAQHAIPADAPATKRRGLFAREPQPAPAAQAAAAPRARVTARPTPAARLRPPRPPITIGGWPLRDALLAAGALIALIAIGLVLASPTPKAPAIAEGTARQSGTPADVGETGTVAAAPVPLSGTAEVAGPAALMLEGRLVRLFGVEAAAGSGADLASYLAGRPVSCRPAAAGATYECAVDGHDLSEVVLFNGGAKAAPDATPALVVAEDHARAQRLGLWRR